MKCDKCGNQLQEGATFCNMCGAAVTPTVTQPPTQPKKGIDIKVIIIIVLVIALLVVGVLLIISNNKGNNKELPNNTSAVMDPTLTTTEEQPTEQINYAKTFDFKDFKVTPEDDRARTKNVKFIKGFVRNYKNSDAIELLFENNNDEMYDGTVYLNYYKEGKRIGSDIGNILYARPHTQFCVSIYPSMYEEFDSFDITYESHMKTEGYKEVPVDTSKLVHNKVNSSYDKKIAITYPNDTSETATYSFLILYKKNGEVVGIHDYSVSNVKPGEIASADISDYFSPVDGYDDYEIIIQSAYSSGQ